MYMFIPLLASISADYRREVYGYTALLILVFSILIPFLNDVFSLGIYWNIKYTAPTYLIFVLLGFLLHEYELDSKWRIGIYILALMGLIMHILGTYKLSYDANMIVSTYKGYENFPNLLYTVGIFVLCKYLGQKLMSYKWFANSIKFIAGYTYSIYLLHFFVMDLLVSIFHINTLSLMYRLGGPFLIAAICVVIGFVVRKIPILRTILP